MIIRNHIHFFSKDKNDQLFLLFKIIHVTIMVLRKLCLLDISFDNTFTFVNFYGMPIM